MIFLSNSFWSLKLLTFSSFNVFDMCLILEKPKEKKSRLTCLENIAASKAWCYPIYSCFDNILIAPCYIKNILNKSCLFILVDKIFDHFKSTYEIYPVHITKNERRLELANLSSVSSPPEYTSVKNVYVRHLKFYKLFLSLFIFPYCW